MSPARVEPREEGKGKTARRTLCGQEGRQSLANCGALPAQWSRIWRYNNRPVVVRETGRGIPNPHLIYVGQTLLLPQVPGASPAPASPDRPLVPHIEAVPDLPAFHSARNKAAPPAAPILASGGGGTSLSERLKAEKSPMACKFRLDELRWPPQVAGAAIIEVRMTGDVLLMTKKQYPITYVTSRGEVEVQVTREANHAFGSSSRTPASVTTPSRSGSLCVPCWSAGAARMPLRQPSALK